MIKTYNISGICLLLRTIQGAADMLRCALHWRSSASAERHVITVRTTRICSLLRIPCICSLVQKAGIHSLNTFLNKLGCESNIYIHIYIYTYKQFICIHTIYIYIYIYRCIHIDKNRYVENDIHI